MYMFKRTVLLLTVIAVLFFGAWHLIIPNFQNRQPTKTLMAFNLTDTNGSPFTEQSIRGHWTVLFFGYPGCPDVCPQTLDIVRQAWESYTPNKQPPAKFVFANIDPNPNTNMELKSFLHAYNPNFIGVSGDHKEIAQLCDQLGIFHEQQTNRIDHTAALLIIDPQARLTAIISPPFTAEDIVNNLELLTHK